VKLKYLFLLKFTGYSLILFIFGHQLLHGYTVVLSQAMMLVNSSYHVPSNLEPFLYGSSMTIIAFLALILATPGVSVKKKSLFITMGMTAFFFTDFIFIQYVIFPQGQPVSNEDSPLYEIYLCIKWLLPFLLWLIVSYPYLGQFLKATGKKDAKTYACPICAKRQTDVVSHLMEAHGEQSLRRKKVRRFISENPELSLASDRLNPLAD
jgi:hypothetical protein